MSQFDKNMQYGYFTNVSFPDFVMLANVGTDFILEEHVAIGPVKRIANNQLTPHITLLWAITPSLGIIHSKMSIGGAKQGGLMVTSPNYSS